MLLGHSRCYLRCASSWGNQLLFKVKELSLEAWVGVDHGTLRLHIAHRLKQGPILMLHKISNDTGCWSRLASVTVKHTHTIVKIFHNLSIIAPYFSAFGEEWGAAGGTYQCTKTVPPDLIASCMYLTAFGICFPMFSQGTSITLITL